MKVEPPFTSETTRRSFLGMLLASISALVAVLMAIPLVRFAVYPVFHGGGSADWFALGKVEGFTAGSPQRAEVTVRKQDGWRVTQSKQTVWITRDQKGELLVLSALCTHLGCVVPWNEAKQMFACPCHAGFYAKDGARISGPPPRGLDPLPIKIESGVLYVRYQYFRQLTPNREIIG